MNRDMILQILSELPPERLGELVAAVQNPEQVIDIDPNKAAGFKGSIMPAMMKRQNEIYRGPI